MKASCMFLLNIFVAATFAAVPAFTQTSSASTSDPWWRHAVIYEIYPRSFGDSNGDGTGDLNGVTEHLDYLEKLGVDAVWLAPMYPSPQVDFGYDISDYEAVDPQYGTMKDFDRLQSEAAKRHIRVVLDLVLNHTSDKHAWFIESSSSRTNSKADWFVWNSGVAADAPGVTAYQKKYEHEGKVPPNNWVSLFGGSAWEWSPKRKQFYYHKYYKQQPDLNWRNPAVEKAMLDVIRFWLDRGVAGFRLDAVPDLFEDPQLPNEPETGGLNAQGDPKLKSMYTSNLPEVHDVIQRMRKLVDSYPDNRVLIGETYLPNISALDEWYGGSTHDQLHLPMDMMVGFGDSKKLSAPYFRKRLEEVETQVHGSQPLIVFDNHDQARSIDRFGDGTHNVEIAKVIATLLLTSRATALTYYGADIGMPTTVPTRKEDVKDPIGVTGWPREKGRDGERTPMQWSPGPQAGFSTNPKTWLPIPSSYKSINVQTESADPNSLLNWYKTLIALRRSDVALHDGDMRMLNTDDLNILSFVRTAPLGEMVATAMNMSGKPQSVSFDGKQIRKTMAASASSLQEASSGTSITLPPFSSWVGVIQ
jgi:alpha-glucosidase